MMHTHIRPHTHYMHRYFNLATGFRPNRNRNGFCSRTTESLFCEIVVSSCIHLLLIELLCSLHFILVSFVTRIRFYGSVLLPNCRLFGIFLLLVSFFNLVRVFGWMCHQLTIRSECVACVTRNYWRIFVRRSIFPSVFSISFFFSQ